MTRLIHVAVLSLATLAVASKSAEQQPAVQPILGQLTSQGCFSKLPAGAEAEKSKSDYTSSGYCYNVCKDAKKSVTITGPNGCYCADTYPAESALVKDDKCSHPCPAYPMEACGGDDAYSVFNTGIELVVENDGDDAETSAKTTTVEKTTSAAATSAATSSVEPLIPSTPSANAPTTAADGTNGAKSTPSSTSTDVPNAAPRLSSPVGKLVRMVKVFFN